MEEVNKQQEDIGTCVFCREPLSRYTYDFFGVEMHDCKVKVTDRHILAAHLDPDTMSGLARFWALVPYDPVTMELKDWCLFGSIEHDNDFKEQKCSLSKANSKWLATNKQAIATIKDDALRTEWEGKLRVMYRLMVIGGFPIWWARKFGLIK